MLMKRWWAWAGLLLLVLLLVAGLALAKPSPPTFDFLVGIKPLKSDTYVRDEVVDDTAYYSLQGDFKQVQAAAEKELLALGYVVPNTPAAVDGKARGDLAVYMKETAGSRVP